MPPIGTRTARIAFIGAGAANFGGGEGPWDHATRLEKLGNIEVVGIADPDEQRARRVLAQRRGGGAPAMYAQTEVFADFRQMLQRTRPDAVFLAVPPAAHAGTAPPRDMELACAAAGVHLFIEKPLSADDPEALRPVADAMTRAAAGGLIVCVGYMFRYSRAIEAMRRIIEDTPGGVRAVVLRYNCAYSRITKKEWWDTRFSGGPIVEQATHFCDLARYLAGEVDPGSVRAVCIDPSSARAQLADIPRVGGRPLDDGVPPGRQVPRVTAAVWRFADGGVGSLTHGTLLHEAKYESEVEVWGDGLRMVLQDPYGACRLLVRRPHSEVTEVVGEYADDDPYLSEDAAFMQAVRSGDGSLIRSPYADAYLTHQLTWAIRRAAERSLP